MPRITIRIVRIFRLIMTVILRHHHRLHNIARVAIKNFLLWWSRRFKTLSVPFLELKSWYSKESKIVFNLDFSCFSYYCFSITTKITSFQFKPFFHFRIFQQKSSIMFHATGSWWTCKARKCFSLGTPRFSNSYCCSAFCLFLGSRIQALVFQLRRNWGF